MKFILAITFVLLPFAAIAKATAGYGYGLGNDPIALTFAASPMVTIIASLVP